MSNSSNSLTQNNDVNKEMSMVSHSKFQKYLKHLGLPSKGIIASVNDRVEMQKNLPDEISKLPVRKRKEATYMSKFVACVAIGLNDAALNYLWDAVIKKLRYMVIEYGLSIFYDAAVSQDLRSQYKSKNDLSQIQDSTLLKTCKKLGIINKNVYTKLTFVLNSRNNMAASHPNDSQVGPFQVLGELEMCINSVLENKIPRDVIQIPRFIKNLKQRTEIINSTEINASAEKFKHMSTTQCDTILQTLFGMFTDRKINKTSKNNIIIIAPYLWNYSSDDIKYAIGIKIKSFEDNLENDREKLGTLFLEKCNGLNYETKSDIALRLSQLSDLLIDEHNSRDNFYHEIPTIKAIMNYVKSSNDIPKNVLSKLILTILTCSLGKPGVTYQDGVSQGAQKYYHKFFELLNNSQINTFFKVVVKNASLLTLGAKNCNAHFIEIINIFNKSTDLSPSLKEVIKYFLSNDKVTTDKKLKSKKFHLLYEHIK